jgi:two-component system response regulator AtoC
LAKEFKGKKMATMKKVLILDDEPNMRHMLTMVLEKADYLVTGGENGQEGLSLLAADTFDFILCDIKMPIMDGMVFLDKSVQARGDATVIMMSAFGAIDTAIEAMKQGAYDFISKPFKTDEVLLTLKKAEERENLKSENRQLKAQIKQVKDEYQFGSMLARSKSMRKVFSLAEKVAQFDTTVLITGQSGTGKELIARGIHFSSARAGNNMVIENCGCVPEHLLESVFFGHRKGAFTGADQNRKGLFEEADKGTIFLDEIGDLPLNLQVKLLRVLQEGEIRPLGSDKSFMVDVRVVAATAKDLAQEVQDGRFREDLFYRLNVLPLHLPSLKRRPADIPLLCDHFIAKLNDKMGMNIGGIDKQAMKLILQHVWPGNVRELENMIERAMVLAETDRLCLQDFPGLGAGSSACVEAGLFSGYSLKNAKIVWEKNLIEKTLGECNGNRSRAAEMLEISYPSLLNKIKEYQVQVKRNGA